MLLEFEHVTGIKDDFCLQDISFSLPAGYIIGLAGKNGAGKTTLIDYIMNPKQRYNGVIRINGVNIRDNHVQMKNKIGFISDENEFLNKRTAGQNAEILGSLYEEWDMDIFKEAMKQMGLSSYSCSALARQSARAANSAMESASPRTRSSRPAASTARVSAALSSFPNSAPRAFTSVLRRWAKAACTTRRKAFSLSTDTGGVFRGVSEMTLLVTFGCGTKQSGDTSKRISGSVHHCA